MQKYQVVIMLCFMLLTGFGCKVVPQAHRAKHLGDVITCYSAPPATNATDGGDTTHSVVEPPIPNPVIPPTPPGAPLMPAPFRTNATDSGQFETEGKQSE